jgi:hypothetical protein
MTLKTRENIPGPVVIGGIGGSGTRVIAEILREVNFFIGNDLNGPLDNLTYTLLFKRRKWFYENRNNRPLLFRGLTILEKRMTRSGSLSVPELLYVANAGISMSRYGHNREKDGSGKWPLERIRKMFEKLPGDISNHAGWGWKEPNSHLLITEMNEFFPRFKYIHTVRHGLDMAFSDNQQQLFNWGPMFGVDLPGTKQDVPPASFRYWVKANRLALEKGEKLGPKKFLWINYDRLCINPEPEIRKLFSFLEITADETLTRKCAALPRIASTTGRFRNHKLDGFKDEELTFLQSLGFEI